jgi:uncharacterized protein (DUF1330 family)
MSTILVTLITFIDQEEYAHYAAMAGKLFMAEGVKVHVNDENPERVAGDIAADKVVVLEFRDDAHMAKVLGSEAYQAAMVHREKAIKIRTLKVERFQMPKTA